MLRDRKSTVKNLFASILILSILSFQFSELLVYSVFKINQDYIAKNLCVEKDVEDSTCKGCCQLAKKVNEQQEQKQELPPNQLEKQNINFCKQGDTLNFLIYPIVNIVQQKPQTHYLFISYYSIFHPPEQSI